MVDFAPGPMEAPLAGSTPKPPSDYGIGAARAAGYSDKEITDYIAKNSSIAVSAAKKAGYDDTEILDHLSPESAARKEAAPDDQAMPSVDDYGRVIDTSSAPKPSDKPQSQIASDVNAVGQGVVGGTGRLIAGAGRQISAGAARNTSGQLAAMDAIDQGKDIPADQDPMGYQSMSPEQRAKVRADLEGVAPGIANREPNALTRAGMDVQDAAPKMFPVAPENEGIQTGAGRLIGNLGPALVATAAGSAVGGPVGGVLTSAAIIGSQAYDSTYQEATAKGASPDAADDAAGKAALGQIAAMSLPISRVLQMVPVPMREGFVQTLVNIGQHGIEVGAGNALGTLAQNYVAQQSYDPDRSITQGVGTAGLEGTIAGLVIRGGGAAIRAVGGRSGANDAAPPPGNERWAVDGADERLGRVADISAAQDIDGAIAAAAKAVAAPTQTAAPIAEAQPASSWRDLFRSSRQDAAPVVDQETAGLSRGLSADELTAADAVREPARGGEADDATTGAATAAGAVEPPKTTVEPAIVRTSAEAKTVASAYYKEADRIGGTLTPEFTNKFIDEAKKIAPQTPEERAVAGDTAITGLVERIETLRDQPISLAGAQGIDKRLGNMIDAEYGLKGLSSEGRELLNLQTTFRNMILDAKPEDTTGGIAGFEAIKQGRVAWSQAMKMTDLERILNRAELTDNPVTSIRAGVRALVSNQARVRGWSDEEVAALKDAGERGTLGSILHVFGSRLAPLAVGAAGMSTGIVPGLIGAGVTHLATSGMRNMATSIQAGRTNNAMEVLGRGVPAPPEGVVAPSEMSATAQVAPEAAPPTADRPVAPELPTSPTADAQPVQTPLEREQAAVADMRAKAEQSRVETAPPSGGKFYDATTALTPAGKPVAVRYVVREADDLTPSQLPDGRANPDFPPELQPRDRTRAASTAQVASIAQNLAPERLGYAADTATGAPVIGPDGIVESGNGRTMAIKQAYAEGSTAADSYRNWLAKQGFNIEGMKNPVLVRERTEPLDMKSRAQLADEMGASPTMAMAASERAAADAKRIPSDTLSLLKRGDVTSVGNAPFVRAFAKHAIPASERASFMTADGDLSVEGATRVRNALTQRAYGDNALVTSLAENAEPELKAFGGALVDAAGPMAKLRGAIEAGTAPPTGDISGPLIEAARIIQTARRARISIADAVGQTDAFSQRDPRTERILRATYGEDFTGRISRPKLANTLSNFADEMQVQSGLFGDNKTADQVFDEATRK